MTFPIIMGSPESSFDVQDITVDSNETTAHARMTIQRWMCHHQEQVRPGNLGVLMDNVLGYTIIASAPQDHWVVTTEMWVDVTGPLPAEGAVLHGKAELVDRNATDGYAEARVVDHVGRVVARARQRSRFVPGLPRVHSFAPLDLAAGSRLGHRLPVPPEENLTRTEHGLVTTMEVSPQVANPSGNLHGGVAMAWSELAGAAALRRSAPALTTTSVHVTYVRPAPAGEKLKVAATASHQGRSLGLAHVVFTLSDTRPCMFATVTARGSGEVL